MAAFTAAAAAAAAHGPSLVPQPADPQWASFRARHITSNSSLLSRARTDFHARMTSLAPNPNPHLSPFLPTPDLLGQPPPGLTAEERAEWHVHDLQHARMLWILTHTTDPDMPIDLVGQRARSATPSSLRGM